MLSRHFFRAKVLQSLYAFQLDTERNMRVAEKNLLHAVERLYDLYIYQLSTIKEITSLIESQNEEEKNKYFSSSDELETNKRFLETPLLISIAKNKSLGKNIEGLRIQWTDHKDIFRSIYSNFKQSKECKSYLALKSPSFNEEKQLITALFKEIINYPSLVDQFIEKNLFWEDDFDQIAQIAYTSLRDLEADFNEDAEFKEFLDIEKEDEEVKEFVLSLFRNTILHDTKLTEMIRARISNWEYERIAIIDVILVKMAIIEFLHFPSIPVKVTINEYIDLSKEFSTEKSKVFVNGILDKLAEELKNEGSLRKTGRGLINQ